MNSREEKNKDKQEKIENEELKELRIKRVKLVVKIFLIVFFLLSISYFYTKYISTMGLIIKEDAVVNSKLPENFSGTKLIQFSDLHYGSTIFLDEVKSLVKNINKRKPDLIVFTGDLIDSKYKLSNKEQESLTKELSKLNATLGKYAIDGEEDDERFTTIFNQCGFTVLDNSSDLIYKDNTSSILMVGLDSKSKNQNIDKAFSYFNEPTHNSNIYTITLLHEPDSIDDVLAKYPTDLALAGHSHNGQIRIPKLPPLIRKDGAKKYPDEFYKIKNTSLYVSSGLGTSGPHLRIGAHPSINFLRLRTK